MTTIPIRDQRSCLSFVAIPERRYGVPSYDGEVISSLRIPIEIDIGSFEGEYEIVRDLVGKRYGGAAPEYARTAGRLLPFAFTCRPTPVNLKIVQIIGLNLFGPPIALPWPDAAPESRSPDTDGDLGSWTFDYLEKPTAQQAYRYTGAVVESQIMEAARDNPALRISVFGKARTRSTAFWADPHETSFEHESPGGWPFLFKNGYFYVDGTLLPVESFRVSVTNPTRYAHFGDDGLANAYGCDAQEVTVELSFPMSEALWDTIEGWFRDDDFTGDFRAMFVHPSSTRLPVLRDLQAGAGVIPMSPEYVASPGTLKSVYGRIRDQMVVAFIGKQLDSPSNTIVEVHKVDGSQGPGGVSPSCFWIQSGPSEGVERYQGLHRGFKGGETFVYTIATEIGVYRCVPKDKRRSSSGGKQIATVVFSGLSAGGISGGQLVDALNPALKTEIRP